MAAVLAGALAAGTAVAAPPAQWDSFSDLVFRHLTQDTGLPFTGATAITQDQQGFLWVGSQNGLARWDGHRFRLYQAGDAGSGLRDDLIKVLHVDPRGRLWIGTNAGGMARYDPASDRFIAYAAGPHGLSHAGIRAIADDGHGALWVATSGGLDHLDPDTETIRRYHHSATDPHSLPADHVSALLLGPNGQLWVGTAAGLSRFEPSTGRFGQILIPGHSAIEQPAVTSLMKDSTGRIWFGTVGAGAFDYDPQTAIVSPVPVHGEQRSLAAQTVTGIVQARADRVWIATAGGGIFIVDAAARQARQVVHDVRVPTSLADDAPVALFRDRRGTVWVGSQRALSRYDPSRTGVWTLLGGTERPGTLSDPDVTSVLAAADGRIWLGLRSGGVQILDPSQGKFAAVSGRASMLRLPTISSFAELANGQVVIGTNAGMFATNRLGARPVPFGFSAAQSRHAITALLEEGQTLWIGRLDGVWRIDTGPAKSHAATRVVESDRLSDQRVMSIAQAPNGALWVGTQNGLDRIIPGSGVAEHVPLSPTGADGLVPSVVADKRGRIWAGVYSHGLAIIEHVPGGWRIRHIDRENGLPDANVDMLQQDDFGNIWASTDNGLAVIDPVSFAVRALNQPDNVAIAAYWNGSGAKTRAGDLVYGGLGGVTIVDPHRVAPPLAPAPLVLTELRVGGNPVSDTVFDNRRAGHAATVHPEANSLFGEFAALDYADPASARYAYRLRGYQEDWITADPAHRSASYTNLPPGQYELEVRFLPPHGPWRPVGLHVPITVLPAWYQTLWWKLGCAVLAVVLTIVIVQLRTAVLRRRQRELEAQVAERTAALRASQHELEQIAYIDVLTGLPNRRMFNDQMRTCLERADQKGTDAALLLIDLDHFKSINDTNGHDAGDFLLTEVAIKLQASIGQYDTLARLGGDEFAILLPDASDRQRIENICRDITRAVAEPLLFNGVRIKSGASIGVAIYKPKTMTSSELYKSSDLALYAAKRNGRGSWAWFSQGLVGSLQEVEGSAPRRSLR